MEQSSHISGSVLIPTSDDSPSVVVVEDQALMGSSLVEVLRLEGIAASALFSASPATIVDDVVELRPSVVLLDLDLGPAGDGVSLIEPLAHAGAAVVVLTGSRDELRHGACLEAGAVGVVNKDVRLDDLVRSIDLAHRGHPVATADERARLVQVYRAWRTRRDRVLAVFESLTSREREVLRAICRGMSVAVMAEELSVSATTVRSHVRSVLTKLGARSQLQAASLAREAGWSFHQY